MKLIASLTSPFVRKVRVVMAEKKLDFQMEIENVWAPDTKIQESNPLGKVPCLVMEDGGTLFDSRVIVEYLDTLSPVSRLIPQTGRERAAVKCWEALADGALDACIIISFPSPGMAIAVWVSRYQCSCAPVFSSPFRRCGVVLSAVSGSPRSILHGGARMLFAAIDDLISRMAGSGS